MLHVVCLLLCSSKKEDHGTAFESNREGGAESLGDGQRPADSAPIVVTE